MDFKKGNEYKNLIDQGITEEELSKQLDVPVREIYGAIEYCFSHVVAKEILKHFCGGMANGQCFCWPLKEETYCDVYGYELECPLKKRSNCIT